MKTYQIVGIVISVILFIIGITNDITACLIAGIVFFFCNIGTIIGVHYKEKHNEKL